MKKRRKMSSGERKLHSKLEEALEVKSLRRIISAYLNYSDAAEEDVKRYERSFNKLPPTHKALLSHFSSKFQRLRRCISINSAFIMDMVQAFEPPIDMSQDVDNCESKHLDNVHQDYYSEERSFGSCQLVSTSGRTLETDQVNGGEGCNLTSTLPEGITTTEVPMNPESVTRRCSIDFDYREESETTGSSHDTDAKIVNNSAERCSVSNSNGNVCSASYDWLDPSLQLNVPLVDVDKVRCIIRNIVRDWAPEGQIERDQCYKPILEELGRLFPARCKDRPPCCLVPGAGLGRLALEISCLGFISQGNEFSYYMMICSSFILNHTETAGEWTIYPWIHSNCNSLTDNDQLRPVSFPDILPASAEITEGFSMCGGDFVEVYSEPSHEDEFIQFAHADASGSILSRGAWDTVVTCFFLDTAHNIVEYIEIISRILRDGGVWINLGPLLYHFADAYGTEDEMSIELSLEDVKRIAFHYGFQLEQEKVIETTYTANPRSMMQNRYSAAFWTMTKRPGTP